MEGKARPAMPSNLPTEKAGPRPVTSVTSAKVKSLATRPPTERVSSLKKPLTGPDP